jgi:hypothetical protein
MSNPQTPSFFKSPSTCGGSEFPHNTISKANTLSEGIDRESTRAKVTITGDIALAEHVLELVAIVG